MYEGTALEDLGALQLADWERRGGRVASTRLGDHENYSLQIVEIPPGGSLKPEPHRYDAIMLVIGGRGITNIWQPGEEPHTVEWQEGSLLAIPLNARHPRFRAPTLTATDTAREVLPHLR